jgi:hypothetical protein
MPVQCPIQHTDPPELLGLDETSLTIGDSLYTQYEPLGCGCEYGEEFTRYGNDIGNGFGAGYSHNFNTGDGYGDGMMPTLDELLAIHGI